MQETKKTQETVEVINYLKSELEFAKNVETKPQDLQKIFYLVTEKMSPWIKDWTAISWVLDNELSSQEPSLQEDTREITALRVDIRKELAKNPNTPRKILEDLGVWYPELFWENPVLDLWLLQDPGIIGKWNWKLIKALTEDFNCPNWIMKYCVKEKYLIENDCPAGLLSFAHEYAQFHDLPGIIEILSSHENTPLGILEELVELVENDSLWVELIYNPSISKYILDCIVDVAKKKLTDENEWDFNLIHTLTLLISREHILEGVELLGISEEQIETLYQAGKDLFLKEDCLCIKLAGNRETPSWILEDILERESRAEYPNTSILSKLGYNPNSSTKILKKLSESSNPSVKSAVAMNVATPEEILLVLAKDPNYSVFRAFVQRRFRVPEKVLEVLKNNENDFFRKNPNPQYGMKKKLTLRDFF